MTFLISVGIGLKLALYLPARPGLVFANEVLGSGLFERDRVRLKCLAMPLSSELVVDLERLDLEGYHIHPSSSVVIIFSIDVLGFVEVIERLNRTLIVVCLYVGRLIVANWGFRGHGRG